MCSIEEIREYHNKKKSDKLSVKAYNIIRELIITINLVPGRIYSENELSEIAGIGRTPVREAIKKLEAANILFVVPRSGVKISDVRMEDYALQREVRNSIEKLVIRRAARHALAHERKILTEIIDNYEQACKDDDIMSIIRYDTEYHNAITQYARNPYAKNVLTPFQIAESRLYFIQYYEKKDEIKKMNDAHLKMMRLVVEGKSEEACAQFDLVCMQLEKTC